MVLRKHGLPKGKLKSGCCWGLFVIGYLTSTCGAFLGGGGIIRLARQPSTLRINTNSFQKPSLCSQNLPHTQRGRIDIASSLTGENETHTSDEHESNSKEEKEEENNEIIEVVPLKEDAEFIAAVKEVKEAAKNVTASSVQFTSAIVTKGPGIFWRLFTALVEKEIRYVTVHRDWCPHCTK